MLYDDGAHNPFYARNWKLYFVGEIGLISEGIQLKSRNRQLYLRGVSEAKEIDHDSTDSVEWSTSYNTYGPSLFQEILYVLLTPNFYDIVHKILPLGLNPETSEFN
jgi:hypothetical protein